MNQRMNPGAHSNSGTRPTEQRWGTRYELNVPARITTAEGVYSDGRVRNASLSGAFVETAARVPLLSRVALRPLTPGSSLLDARVVRVEADGLALEWIEPPLYAVSALLSLRLRDGTAPPAGHRNPKKNRVVQLFPERQADTPPA